MCKVRHGSSSSSQSSHQIHHLQHFSRVEFVKCAMDHHLGYPPFSESHDSAPLNEQILKGLYTFPDEFWSEISAPAKDLIRQMMCVDPIKRLTITSVLEHPWLANDHDNTVRVDKIMYPTLQTMKSMKRAARDEEAAMDQGDETSSADIYPSSGKNNKRIKY
ncbi:unnamed protein product [Rotaria magnacalcarata]|uniref:Protein kinase domain-containing protein n=1 Tax=Rotaria magnacalcarata TaxID=392030 RepID=A0A816KSU2_9BILA|nr:unnamed protein product [Rotaria magnacalcarata]